MSKEAKPEKKRRISIEELEALLVDDEKTPIEILPNGEVGAVGESNGETGDLKPLTYRENLGGEYGHVLMQNRHGRVSDGSPKKSQTW